jgi:hypothetical protein
VGVARRIWLHKNEVIYGGNFVPPAMLMKLSTDVVVDFQKANEMDPSVMTMDKTSGWIAPSSGWVVAHWDAAIDCTRGRLGLGVILRDRDGRFVATKLYMCRGYSDATAAEAYAALEAIQLGWDLGYEQIQFMGDVQVVINAVNFGEPDWSKISHLIKGYLHQFTCFLAVAIYSCM